MIQLSNTSKVINENIKDPIRLRILPIGEVTNCVKTLLIESYLLSEVVAEKIVTTQLSEFLLTLKSDLFVAVESPYVDKIYRDAYYNYYSSKLNKYSRDCIRLSFFNKEVTPENFRRFKMEQDVADLKAALFPVYFGFLVLRPTFPKVIGRNAISPKAIKNDQIICCLTKIGATVNGIKQKVLAFPHASQDHQTMTCAETTVWSNFRIFWK